jgi:hypothetical protein
MDRDATVVLSSIRVLIRATMPLAALGTNSKKEGPASASPGQTKPQAVDFSGSGNVITTQVGSGDEFIDGKAEEESSDSDRGAKKSGVAELPQEPAQQEPPAYVSSDSDSGSDSDLSPPKEEAKEGEDGEERRKEKNPFNGEKEHAEDADEDVTDAVESVDLSAFLEAIRAAVPKVFHAARLWNEAAVPLEAISTGEVPADEAKWCVLCEELICLHVEAVVSTFRALDDLVKSGGTLSALAVRRAACELVFASVQLLEMASCCLPGERASVRIPGSKVCWWHSLSESSGDTPDRPEGSLCGQALREVLRKACISIVDLAKLAKECESSLRPFVVSSKRSIAEAAAVARSRAWLHGAANPEQSTSSLATQVSTSRKLLHSGYAFVGLCGQLVTRPTTAAKLGESTRADLDRETRLCLLALSDLEDHTYITVAMSGLGRAAPEISQFLDRRKTLMAELLPFAAGVADAPGLDTPRGGVAQSRFVLAAHQLSDDFVALVFRLWSSDTSGPSGTPGSSARRVSQLAVRVLSFARDLVSWAGHGLRPQFLREAGAGDSDSVEIHRERSRHAALLALVNVAEAVFALLVAAHVCGLRPDSDSGSRSRMLERRLAHSAAKVLARSLETLLRTANGESDVVVAGQAGQATAGDGD